MMSKLLIGLIGAGVIATGGYAAASGLDDAAPARTVSLPGATSTNGTTTGVTTGTTTTGVTTNATTTGEDVSGPCDEAEHRNEPRCAGSAAPAPAPPQRVTTGDDGPGDVSGPCDEAEHANDPRCTSGAIDDDRSGSDNSSGTEDDNDDRSELNEGSNDASDDDVDDDDRSGSDEGSDDDDDGDDDRSGSNSDNG